MVTESPGDNAEVNEHAVKVLRKAKSPRKPVEQGNKTQVSKQSSHPFRAVVRRLMSIPNASTGLTLEDESEDKGTLC